MKTESSNDVTRILVVGGGYVGMYTALRLQRKLKQELRQGTVEVIVVDPEPYMTYQPFLPEAAAGSISPRHVVVPLRRVLPRVPGRHRRGHRHRPRPTARRHDHHPGRGGGPAPAPSRSTTTNWSWRPAPSPAPSPSPASPTHGIGFKTVEEAIGLRNHVLEQLDIASSTRDPEVRDAALTFVFVGGGYAGVEALAELEDMARYAVRYYHNVQPEDMKWILVEATDRILPEVGEDMGTLRRP